MVLLPTETCFEALIRLTWEGSGLQPQHRAFHQKVPCRGAHVHTGDFLVQKPG
jgi:hypothetical protein